MKDIQDIFITKNNKKWIDALAEESIFSLRKLLKKERGTLPQRYRRLYLEDEERLTKLMYTLIMYAPGLTHLKSKARNYFRANESDVEFPLNNCEDCKWFLIAPPTEDNLKIQGEDRFKSCEKLGALASDLACEGYTKMGEQHEPKRISGSDREETQNHKEPCQ